MSVGLLFVGLPWSVDSAQRGENFTLARRPGDLASPKLRSVEHTESPLLESPLHAAHERAGAKFAEFGGWRMPLEYSGGGVLAEHAAVRETVGLFDVSHLGKATLSGPGAVAAANTILTNDLDKISAGKSQYTMLCHDDGGVVDDLIAYRISDNELFVMPNAANCAEVIQTLREGCGEGVEVIDQHREFAVIAVQGPKSAELLRRLGLPTEHGYMGFERVQWSPSPAAGEAAQMTVCRTGYTGEQGYELVLPAASALALWDELARGAVELGGRPAGLAARDTLRTEMGYPLHGQDLGPDITPVMARSGWAVGWNKDTFHGAAALRAQREGGADRVLRGLKAVGRGIPRPHMDVVDEEGQLIGEVTSGTFSPTLKTGIALALLDAGIAIGDRVQVAIRSRREPFEVVKPPFVQAST